MWKKRVWCSAQCFVLFGFGQDFSVRCILMSSQLIKTCSTFERTNSHNDLFVPSFVFEAHRNTVEARCAPDELCQLDDLWFCRLRWMTVWVKRCMCWVVMRWGQTCTVYWAPPSRDIRVVQRPWAPSVRSSGSPAVCQAWWVFQRLNLV